MADKPHQISGVVRDTDGNPVADAQIYFTDSPVALPDIAVLTNADGEFTLSVPTDGKYGLGFNAEGFAPKTATVNVKSSQPEAQVDIKLKK